jgi:hypothetical protein
MPFVLADMVFVLGIFHSVAAQAPAKGLSLSSENLFSVLIFSTID